MSPGGSKPSERLPAPARSATARFSFIPSKISCASAPRNAAKPPSDLGPSEGPVSHKGAPAARKRARRLVVQMAHCRAWVVAGLGEAGCVWPGSPTPATTGMGGAACSQDTQRVGDNALHLGNCPYGG